MRTFWSDTPFSVELYHFLIGVAIVALVILAIIAFERISDDSE